ncbi:MAG: helix-turn-helix domain-containing protein [Gemmatimonadota bacterium]
MKAAYDLHVRRPELPSPLRRWVHEYYETGMDVPRGETARIPISATTDPVLNVMLSGSLFVRIGDGFRLPPVTIGGAQPAAYALDVSGTWRGFYVRFTTVGPLALLGVDDYSLIESGPRPLHEMVRPELTAAARAWEADLVDADDFEERVVLTSRFLLAHHREPDRRVRLLEAAVEAIDQAGGNVRIGELARGLGVAPSTLRRHFSVLGMSPKRFACIVRFRRAHEYLRTNPDAGWSDVIGRFGYADQAHFIRDYRRFSGSPPTGWEPAERLVDRRMGIEGPPHGDGED